MTTSELPASHLSIGELARCAGVTSRVVRHYHAIGLLAEPPRDAAGYRRYGPADLARLVDICRLRALGVPVHDIASALEEPALAEDDVPAGLLSLAIDVDLEIERLRGVHDRLVSLAGSPHLVDPAELFTAGATPPSNGSSTR